MWGRSAAVGIVLVACARPPAAGSPGDAPSTAEAACGACHAEEVRAWSGSMHRAALTDATFQASLALEHPADRAWCTDCHAPRTRGGAKDPRLAAAGVDCLVCHGPGALARHGAPGGPRIGVVVGCASCHEFPFPDRPAALVQSTATEHAASAARGTRCEGCHMPRAGGGRDHAFRLGGHAPETLGDAVDVAVTRIDARTARVTVRSAAGHAFPTGDMFRRARLELTAEGARGEILATTERVFERTWSGRERPDASLARSEVADTRVRGLWTEAVSLDTPEGRDVARVRWLLRYERVLAVRGGASDVASSDAIAEGEVSW